MYLAKLHHVSTIPETCLYKSTASNSFVRAMFEQNPETFPNSCDYDIQLSELSPDQCHDKVKSVSTGNFPYKWTGFVCQNKSWGLEVFR